MVSRASFPAKEICQTCSSCTSEQGVDGAYCGLLQKSMNGWEPSHCYFYTQSDSSKAADATQFPVDVVIICAVQVEYEAILDHLFDIGRRHWDHISVPNDGRWRTASIPVPGSSATIRVACGKSSQMGLSAAATITTAAMHVFKPRFLVMAGITAGRSGATGFGDVIVPDKVWDYGEGRWQDMDGQMVFVERRSERAPDRDLTSWVESVITDADFGSAALKSWLDLDRSNKTFPAPRVRIGNSVSGAAVIDSQNFWTDIVKEKKVIGLDMEAYGFALAVETGGGPRHIRKWLVAKAVCDYGVSKDKDAQPFAAFCSTKFVQRFISEYIMKEDISNNPQHRNVI